ncbi:MAG: septum site-determining protein MinC [Francisellaceae bacterium]
MQNAFQLKGSLFTLSVLQVLKTSLSELEKQLTVKIKQVPQFFNNTPMVIDLMAVEEQVDELYIEKLNAMLKKHTLLPVGYRLSESVLMRRLQKLGYPIFKEGRNLPAPKTVPDNEECHSKSRLVDTRIRSGQQVIAQTGDLIITSSVSPGVELLADGNIHVYGTLRGRAVAGLSGDSSARIFCRRLEADLISIAGQYRIFEEPIAHTDEFANGYQIQLKDGTILVSPL